MATQPLTYLLQELQSIYAESKRKYPEVREAADHAIGALRLLPPNYQLTKDRGRLDIIKAPILLAFHTKHQKICASAASCLQRLVSLGALVDGEEESIDKIVDALNQAAIHGSVETQLKILQILLYLVTNVHAMHDARLLEVLVICFRLHELRVPVVSSTAAATLRQIVVVLFDRVQVEDEQSSLDPSPVSLTNFVVQLDLRVKDELPADIVLCPAAKDAYQIFHDLCSFANGDNARYIQLKSLSKTFCLELIESIISNHSDLFKRHPELVQLLRQAVCPMLLKNLSEKCSFPIRLRSTRVAYLLIKQHTEQLSMECEIFMNLLLKSTESGKDIWQRAIGMEVMRGICADFQLISRLWSQFDAVPDSTDLLSSMISAFNKVATEKPALLGTAPRAASATTSQQDVGMSGIMEAATMGTMSMIPSADSPPPGLSSLSSMKIQCIDQLDKTDAPVVPETYIQYLALTNLCTFIASITSTSRTAVEDQSLIAQVASVAWPGLLASLTFYLSTNLDRELYASTLASFQTFLQKAGRLGLVVARDAFLTSLTKLAVPPDAVSHFFSSSENGTVKVTVTNSTTPFASAQLAMANLVFSQRTLDALEILLQVSDDLAAVLGDSWLMVLETLQNAEMIFTAVLRSIPANARHDESQATSPRPDQQVSAILPSSDPLAVSERDLVQAKARINSVFENSVGLDVAALRTFIQGLCRLAAAMVGLSAEIGDETMHGQSSPSISSNKDHGTVLGQSQPLSAAVRRTSGALILRTLRIDEKLYILTKLDRVAELNFKRLISPGDPENDSWECISRELVAVMSHPETPVSIQIQSAQSLQFIMLGLAKLALEQDVPADRIMIRLLQSLRSIIGFRASESSSHDHRIRESGLVTLNHLVESCGQALDHGWSIIFSMLRSVTDSAEEDSEAFVGIAQKADQSAESAISLTAHRALSLIRSAFPTMQLICSDFLSALSSDELKDCVHTLGTFARQREDLNMAITATNLLWTVSDSIRGQSMPSDKKDQLWIATLAQLAALARDSRSDVRNGAAQIIYRSIDAHGSELDGQLWHKLLYEILFPLLEDTDVRYEQVAAEARATGPHRRTPSFVKRWAETKMLLSSGVIDTIRDSLQYLVSTPAFGDAWQVLLMHFQRSLVSGDNQISTSAAQSIEKFLGHAALPNSCRVGIESMWHAAAIELSSAPPSLEISQEALTSLINLGTSIIKVASLKSPGSLRQSLAFLRFAAEYAFSPTYRPDVDHLTPCQLAITAFLDSLVELPTAQRQLVLDCYIQFIHLPFEATAGKVTHVALCKTSMANALKLHEGLDTSGEHLEITNRLAKAYGIAIAAKYDCPPASKYGDDPPLWQTAIEKFVSLARAGKSYNAGDNARNAVETIHKIVKSGLSADTEKAKLLTKSERNRDEDLTMMLLDLWKTRVHPYLAGIKSPNERDRDLMLDAAQTMQEASRLYRLVVSFETREALTRIIAASFDSTMVDVRLTDDFTLIADASQVHGTLVPLKRLTNERVRLECLEQLFTMAETDNTVLAEVTRPLLSRRLAYTLKTYLADMRLSGCSPLPRVRQVELIRCLKRAHYVSSLSLMPSLGDYTALLTQQLVARRPNALQEPTSCETAILHACTKLRG